MNIAVAEAESRRRITKGKNLKFKKYAASTSDTATDLGNGNMSEYQYKDCPWTSVSGL
jgi:hypothetical protein